MIWLVASRSDLGVVSKDLRGLAGGYGKNLMYAVLEWCIDDTLLLLVRSNTLYFPCICSDITSALIRP